MNSTARITKGVVTIPLSVRVQIWTRVTMSAGGQWRNEETGMQRLLDRLLLSTEVTSDAGNFFVLRGTLA